MSALLAAVTPADILVPASIGALLSACVVVGLLVWRRQQRRRLGVRPPIETSLLRPAGHTLQLRLQESEEKSTTVLLSVMFYGAVTALLTAVFMAVFLNPKFAEWMAQNGGLAVFLRRPLLSPTLTVGLSGFAALGGLIYEINRMLRLDKQSRNLRLGLRGEQAVAEALQQVAPLGYRAFHDLPAGKDWNIDHVVVGPGGVFTLETKTRSKCKAPAGRKEGTVYYNGKALEFPWGDNTAAVPQAAGAAKWLADFVSQATGRKVEVQPLLIIPGWYVERLEDGYPVKAMNTNYLTKFLAGLPTRLSPEDIQVFAHPISEKCRDVEF